MDHHGAMSDTEPVPGRPGTIGTSRLEAFSDGVMAVIITIMALRAQGAARRPASRALGHQAAGPARLHPQLRLHRHLLEQPPPPAAGHAPHRRRGHVGQPSPALLAVADPGARPSGSAPPTAAPARPPPTGSSASRGGACLLPSWCGRSSGPIRAPPWPPPSAPTPRVGSPCAVLRRHRPGLRQPLDLLRAVRRGGGDLDHPRPPTPLVTSCWPSTRPADGCVPASCERLSPTPCRGRRGSGRLLSWLMASSMGSPRVHNWVSRQLGAEALEWTVRSLGRAVWSLRRSESSAMRGPQAPPSSTELQVDGDALSPASTAGSAEGVSCFADCGGNHARDAYHRRSSCVRHRRSEAFLH